MITKTQILLKFINEQGKIFPRRLTGTSWKFQKKSCVQNALVILLFCRSMAMVLNNNLKPVQRLWKDLKQDMQGLGYKNDLVKVRDGYGRNYLIPNGIATIGHRGQRMLAENTLAGCSQSRRPKTSAIELAAKMGDLTVEIGTKSWWNRWFSVPLQRSGIDARAPGFDVDRKKIVFKAQPKELGTYAAILWIYTKR